MKLKDEDMYRAKELNLKKCYCAHECTSHQAEINKVIEQEFNNDDAIHFIINELWDNAGVHG